MREPTSIIGQSPNLALALDQISRVAPINRPVLILGERGTGKELAAERLHFLSGRWDASLDKVNCAAISDALLESELFGHEPGAFTGATRTHIGRFERADGGTLFLDELGTMSLRLQEKLLRLVEYGEFERLGGQQTLRVDVRVVAATHAPLQDLAARGEFREDLLDRLSFDVVHLPSLAQRIEDIPELAEHFAIAMCRELDWELFPGFSASALQQLLDHHWPGNVRELKNVVERSLYRWGQPDTPLGEIIINPFISPFEPAKTSGTQETSSDPDGPEDQATMSMSPPTPDPGEDFSDQVLAFERRLLTHALAANEQHQGRTAEALGLSYDQLRGLVRKHKLPRRQRRVGGG